VLGGLTLKKNLLINRLSYFNLESLVIFLGGEAQQSPVVTGFICRPNIGPKHLDKLNPEPVPTQKAHRDLLLRHRKPKTSQNRKTFRELINVTLAALPSRLIRQTLVLACSMRVESLYILFAMAAGLHS